MAKQNKKLTRRIKQKLSKKLGPSWKKRIKGRELARELEKIEIVGDKKSGGG